MFIIFGAFFDVVYGENISSDKTPYIIDDIDNSKFNDITLTENALSEICYSTIPSVIDGKTCYKTAFSNPYPEKEIEKLEYVPMQDAKVEIYKIEY